MALTALEQQRIVSGEIGPDQTDLRSLVSQSSFIAGLDFKRNYKEFPTQDGNGDSINQKASAYLSKVMNVINQAVRGNGTVENGSFKMMVSIIGAVPSLDISDVENSTDAQWDAFVAANIMEAMEIVADVRKDEKQAYEAL